MSFQQDFCVNSTVSRKICRGMGERKKKEKKKKRSEVHKEEKVSWKSECQPSIECEAAQSQKPLRHVVDTSSSSNDSGTDTEPNVTPLKFQTRVTRSLFQRQNLSGCMAF